MSELRTLKAGDKVIMDRGWMNGGWSVQTVEKVTPSGQIRLHSGDRFTVDYNHIGRQFGGYRLILFTPENSERYEVMQLRKCLKSKLEKLAINLPSHLEGLRDLRNSLQKWIEEEA